MKYAVCLIVCVLPLAACNKSPEVHATNASVGEVASKVAAASAGHELVRPGAVGVDDDDGRDVECPECRFKCRRR